MGKKTPGKVNPPPAQADFDSLTLESLCCKTTGVFYRLHSIDRATGNPWPALHFSRRGNSRFDPRGGVGCLCVAQTLAGALMELFDDHWGSVGSLGRSVTEQMLRETWVSLVSMPRSSLFDATGGNLSKLGTDAQLLTGNYSTARKWAARMMKHPDMIEGILFRSRHDPNRLNVAIFGRSGFNPTVLDPKLTPLGIADWKRQSAFGSALVHGPAVLLRDHPQLDQSLVELQVSRLP